MKSNAYKGFTLIELLIVIAVIAILAAVIFAATGGARTKARDGVRKTEIAQIGQFFALGCYLPDGGPGEYDLAALIVELKQKYPGFERTFKKIPRDPLIGSEEETFYRYLVDAEGKNCAVYANLENDNEPVTLLDITEPTAGAGKGALRATVEGWNNSYIFFQASN